MLNSVCYTLLKQQLFIHPRGDSESVSGIVPCISTSLVFLVGMLEALINYCLQSTGKFSSESCYRNASCCTILYVLVIVFKVYWEKMENFFFRGSGLVLCKLAFMDVVTL